MSDRARSNVPVIALLLASSALPACGASPAYGPSEAAQPAGYLFGDDEPETRTPALQGHVYFVPEGTRALPDFSSLSPVGTVAVDAIEVQPRRSSCGFPGVKDRSAWYAVDYQGDFDVGEQGIYRFRLTSNDGARLSIDGDTILDKDGTHKVSAVDDYVILQKGRHQLRVSYFHGARGTAALVLEVAERGRPYRIFRADLHLGVDDS